jgi:hypothetical protein
LSNASASHPSSGNASIGLNCGATPITTKNDRTHLAHRKDLPDARAIEREGATASRAVLVGLHHRNGRKLPE